MIISGIALLVVGLFLSTHILATTGGILLIVGFFVWILRQAQSVVLASLRNRPPSARVSNLSQTAPIDAVTDGANRGHRADLCKAFATRNGRKPTSGIGVTPHPVQHFSP